MVIGPTQRFDGKVALVTGGTSVRKISPEEVADATLDALARRRPLALVGATRLLPTLLRLAPETAKRLVSET